jgi:hypothetical protein
MPGGISGGLRIASKIPDGPTQQHCSFGLPTIVAHAVITISLLHGSKIRKYTTSL